MLISGSDKSLVSFFFQKVATRSRLISSPQAQEVLKAAFMPE